MFLRWWSFMRLSAVRAGWKRSQLSADPHRCGKLRWMPFANGLTGPSCWTTTRSKSRRPPTLCSHRNASRLNKWELCGPDGPSRLVVVGTKRRYRKPLGNHCPTRLSKMFRSECLVWEGCGWALPIFDPSHVVFRPSTRAAGARSYGGLTVSSHARPFSENGTFGNYGLLPISRLLGGSRGTKIGI
jgi:hypothetical protein